MELSPMQTEDITERSGGIYDGKRVLVTAIGTAAATTIVQELKKNIPGIQILGTDTNEQYQIVTSREVDEFYHFPSSVEDRESYMKFLVGFCEAHRVHYIFSTIDEEVYELTQREELFQSKGVRLCIADADTVRICHFKNDFSRWLRERMPQIAIPEYQDLCLVPEEEYPLFVKPIEGRASNGCRMLQDRQEADSFQKCHKMGDYMIQKYWGGDLVCVDIVRDRRSSVTKICQRIETLRNKSGCGIAVEIIDDPELREICCELAEKLNLNGVVNAEFFKNGTDYKIIEVNPRFSAGSSYSCRAGLNTVLDAFKIANAEPVCGDRLRIGMKLARRYETYEC